MATEKFFMACDTNDDLTGAQYGPFFSVSEAEKYMKTLGWKWIIAYTHHVNDFSGEITRVDKRFFQPDGDPREGVTKREDRKPGDVEALRRMIVQEVPPLTKADEKFFEKYEEQMEGFSL